MADLGRDRARQSAPTAPGRSWGLATDEVRVPLLRRVSGAIDGLGVAGQRDAVADRVVCRESRTLYSGDLAVRPVKAGDLVAVDVVDNNGTEAAGRTRDELHTPVDRNDLRAVEQREGVGVRLDHRELHGDAGLGGDHADNVRVLPRDDVVGRPLAGLHDTVGVKESDVTPGALKGRFCVARRGFRSLSESHRTSDGDIDLITVHCGGLGHESSFRKGSRQGSAWYRHRCGRWSGKRWCYSAT